jgi:hypothetical protein
MAVKKVIIPKSKLKPIDQDNNFLVRFRIISDDRNGISEWSQIFSLSSQTAESLYDPQVASFTSGNVLNIVWQNLPADLQLDIFLKVDGGQYVYKGTSLGSNYLTINPAESTYQFALQISSISKKYSESLKVFESEVLDVV